MSEEKKMNVHKITLSTGKVVLLREMKIKYQELAIKAVGNKAGDNQMLFASMVQKELLKILIFQINESKVGDIELADLDKVFSFGEFSQVNRAVEKVVGGDGAGEFQTETVVAGKQ